MSEAIIAVERLTKRVQDSTGTLTKNGTGTLTLSGGANTNTGALTINGGTVVVSSGGVLAACR